MTNSEIIARLESEGLPITKSFIDLFSSNHIVGFKSLGSTVRIFTDFEFTNPSKSKFCKELDSRMDAVWSDKLMTAPPAFVVFPFRPSKRFVKLTGEGFHAYNHWLCGYSVISAGMPRKMLTGALAHLGCQPPTRFDVVNPDTFDMGFEAADDEDLMLLSIRGGLNADEVMEFFFAYHDGLRQRVAELDTAQSSEW